MCKRIHYVVSRKAGLCDSKAIHTFRLLSVIRNMTKATRCDSELAIYIYIYIYIYIGIYISIMLFTVRCLKYSIHDVSSEVQYTTFRQLALFHFNSRLVFMLTLNLLAPTTVGARINP